MLLVEMLLDKFPCVVKMLGVRFGCAGGNWSSGVVAVDQRSRDDEESVETVDPVEDVDFVLELAPEGAVSGAMT